ncbi:MAG: TolC family protein [Campylobacterota bacterium]|nr:TolC family protein [Campylobacterota bacterium]
MSTPIKKSAYNYGELSKKDLLILELEMQQLEAKITLIKASEHTLRHQLLLQTKLHVDSEFICNDLHKIRAFISPGHEEYALSKEIYNNLELSTRSAIKRYESSFKSVNVALYYDNETDIKRVGVDLSIPLTFSSEKYEKLRLSSLHKQKKLTFEKEALYLNKNVQSDTLKNQLNAEFQQYKNILKRLNKYQNELMPLVQKSFELNESSLVEYLLTHKNLNELSQELNRAKRTYYQSLFQLYNVLEIKD